MAIFNAKRSLGSRSLPMMYSLYGIDERIDGWLPFYIAKRHEEFIHLGDGGAEHGIISFPVVEKAMRLSFIADELAAVAMFLHFLGEHFGGDECDGGVFHSVEYDCWGTVFSNVVIRRKRLEGRSHTLFEICYAFGIEWVNTVYGREYQGRVEQREGIGDGADRYVFVGAVECDNRTEGTSEMSSCGSAASCDSIGVYTQAFGVGANPAHGGFGVSEAGGSGGPVPRGYPIFGSHGDHAARGEVLAVFRELRRTAASPAAAEEKDDCGAGLAGMGLLGRIDVDG